MDARPELALTEYRQIDSTNRALWRQLMSGGCHLPAAAIAREQTAGRGQWQRTWQSAPGGLYLSIALPAPDVPHGRLPLAIARAIARALRHQGLPVQLKWPNDLILQGKKLGGLLCETRRLGDQAQTVVGLGCNWTNPVPETGINLQTWQQTTGLSAVTGLEQLAAIASYGILTGAAIAANTDWLTDYWQLLAHQQGPVRVQGCPGTAIGVTPAGELRVRLQAPGAATEICCLPGSVRIDYADLSPTPDSIAPPD
ncbi:MAG: biotin--[acetyl-CoA-carboxylase] ligase [Spirulinaceae cyanobacterium SM2_1_0]|nr:biotin--[acetyl-CoA-carboxylase] ligase [Spirulinaceae cyanobacterium SM2_1_0]